MVTLVTRRCKPGDQPNICQAEDKHPPMVESACFHISSPPKTSSISFRTSLVLDVICARRYRRNKRKRVLTAYLFGDWELVGAGVACPFIVACLRRYNKDICAIGTEEHRSYKNGAEFSLLDLILSPSHHNSSHPQTSTNTPMGRYHLHCP